MSLDAPAAARVEPRTIPATHAGARLAGLRLDIVLAIVVFAMAIVPRAAWIAYNDRPPQGLNDPVMYNLLSDLMADGDGYIRPTGEPFAYYPVGFPATVAGLKKAGEFVGWERSIFSIKMMNGMFGALTTVGVFLIAARLFDRRVAFAAGALHAIFPSQVYYTGTILTEPLFTYLFVAALLILLWKPWARTGMPYSQLFAAGLVLSAATMTRGITLIFPLLLLAIWLFYLDSKKRALLQTAVLFAGIAVLIVPWSIRNTLAFDQLTGPSTNLGDDLCIGNYNGADGRFTLTGKCFEGVEGMSPQEVELHRNREGAKIAVQDVLQHPLRMPELIANKAYWLLYKDDDGIWAAESYGHDPFIPEPRKGMLVFAANAIYYATGIIVLLGAAAFALSSDIRRLFVLLAMLYVIAVPLAFFGDPRFHFPAIPLAIIIAAATLLMLWDGRRAFVPGEPT
ncbi:MAG: hypothetical protein WEB52_09415 [Dehalococcoidia bacterium]